MGEVGDLGESIGAVMNRLVDIPIRDIELIVRFDRLIGPVFDQRGREARFDANIKFRASRHRIAVGNRSGCRTKAVSQMEWADKSGFLKANGVELPCMH